MSEVDNKYIEQALTKLLDSIGVKEFADSKHILSLVRSKKIKEAIKEISNYLGLPIEVNISYVPKGYRPASNDGFHSTALVKKDVHGKGTSGITAQVSIPGNLPLYGSPQMINFPIAVRVSEDCAENSATFIAVMAHELSHIVLYAMHHPEKENEFYTDLTAMLLGFGRIMEKGRKVVVTKTENLVVARRTTTTTTTYGYLSDENFHFAFSRIKKALRKGAISKKYLISNVKRLDQELKRQKIQEHYFNIYLSYLDKNLNQNIGKEDGQWIYSFHQPDYLDEFKLATKTSASEVSRVSGYLKNLRHYNKYSSQEIKKFELIINSSITDLSLKANKVRGAIMTLRKYVSPRYRIISYLGILSGMVN
jgi:hypothetical protein